MEEWLIEATSAEDILPHYQGTPVGELLAYHNLDVPYRDHREADLLIGMCMDHRYQMRIPANFAYVLRCAGANLSLVEFDVSFAIAVGGVRCICVIGHDGCRMIDVVAKREAFVSGLVNDAGWDRHLAEAHFDEHVSRYGIEDVVKKVWFDAKRLQEKYEGVLVAPLMYSLGDHNLHQIAGTNQSVSYNVCKAVAINSYDY